MARPTLLILGGSGLLGTDLQVAMTQKWGSDSFAAPTSTELNVLDAKTVRDWILHSRPNWVIHATAFTNVDQAEVQKELCMKLNFEAVANLAAVCADAGSRLIHFGTDQVFDGSSGLPQRESDLAKPVNFYGSSKLRGDEAVLAYPQHLVLRVQWLYGRKKDRFTPLRNVETFAPFSDQWGAPTWALFVGSIVTELIERDASGLFHVAHDDWASWAEVYQFVKDTMGYGVRLDPRTTDSAKLLAKRPRHSLLCNEKLKSVLGVESLGSWKQALATFLSGVRR